MSLSHSPAIVTDGLVLCLDAANQRSYPKSGTTWSDLSGNGNHGALQNMDGANFSSDNRGTLSFDGSNEYVDCGYPSISVGKLTVSAWVKINTGNIYQHVVDSSSNSWHLAILNSNKPYFYNGATFHTLTETISTNTWYMITGVQGSALDLYINGVLSQSISSNINVTTNNIHIGRWQSGGRNFNGDIASAQIYNRALSADEVLQNYLATRGRYK
jgi:hypothetical protein